MKRFMYILSRPFPLCGISKSFIAWFLSRGRFVRTVVQPGQPWLESNDAFFGFGHLVAFCY